MIIKRQSKGTLVIDKQVHVADNFNKQLLSSIDLARQALNWIVYVFTSEQVYSNDGSKVIISGGQIDMSGQTLVPIDVNGQAQGSFILSGQTKVSENFTKQLKIDEDFTREE